MSGVRDPLRAPFMIASKLEVTNCDFKLEVPERHLKFEIANCDLRLGVCYVVALCDYIPVFGLAAKYLKV